MTTHDTSSHHPIPSDPAAADDADVFGFAPQEHLSELTTLLRTGPRGSTSVSYTYYRHPDLRDDPRNFIALTPEQARAIEQAEASDLPGWLIEQVTRVRYPALWDAIRTTPVAPDDKENTLETLLAEHASDVLPSLAPIGPESASGPASPSDTAADRLASDFLIVDGAPSPARRLHLAEGALALGAVLGDRYVTIVYDTHLAPAVSLEVTRRCPVAAPRQATA